ncbi:DUF58 domain-containing protein [Aeromonas enteropelogenes]|uniref:DUF58 domain-containing protein n=1 Tax=Aeromonas enteropelogenes TaxID=29489 RepID=UPI003B9EE5DD
MTPDPRLYCDYPQLAALRAQEPLCRLPPFHRLRQLISGQHVSRLRGRGLNFEELRHYRQGDDIRQLDWRVTFRTGKPHVRVYNEEKDHHVLLCVDQRASMFFASLDTMKSVVAAQCAALLGWSVIRHSDRLALCPFNDEEVAVNTPVRSQGSYLMQLRQLAQFNLALNVSSRPEQTSGLERLLDQLLQRRERDALIVIASDFHDCDEAAISRLQQLQRHSRLLCLLISDPLEHTLQHSDWILSDGTHQIQLAAGKTLQTVNEQLARQSEERHQQLQRLMQMSHLPLIELDTSGHHLQQLRDALGVAR